MFIVWLSKPINVLFTGFVGGGGLTRFVCRPWTSGCTDYCHWATRTPWSCACCWSRFDDQAILWTSSKDLQHVFLHDSRRSGAADAINQGLVGGVDHRKCDSIANVILQPDAISGTRTASWAWGWPFSCSCQHKGQLWWSLRERSRHGWLKQIQVVHWRKSSPTGCPRKTLWGIHNRSQHSISAWLSQGWCWGG